MALPRTTIRAMRVKGMAVANREPVDPRRPGETPDSIPKGIFDNVDPEYDQSIPPGRDD